MYFEIKIKILKLLTRIDGQSTIGHIWNFQNWLVNIKDLKPKAIIFYIGINDLMARKHRTMTLKKLNLNSVNYILNN